MRAELEQTLQLKIKTSRREAFLTKNTTIIILMRCYVYMKLNTSLTVLITNCMWC